MDARHGKLGKTTYEAHTRTRTRERAVRGHGKKVGDARRGRNRTHAMENWAKTRTTHTHVHGPVNGRYVDTHVHGHVNGYERSGRKKGPYAMETGSKLANDGQETVPWQRKHVSWQKNAATAAFQNSVPLLHKLKGRGPNGG